VFAFLYVKANSKEICEEIFFPSPSAFVLRFKANYNCISKKMCGYPLFFPGFQQTLQRSTFSTWS